MKLVKVLLVLTMAVALLGVFPKPASAIVYSYTSGFQVQNLGATDAQIQLRYFVQQAGTTAGSTAPTPITTVQDTIPGSGSKTYFPIQAPDGFNGSVVISSSTPLASIVNLVAGKTGNASYIGLTQGSTSVNLPLLMQKNAGITTWYTVQNVGPSNATVNVSYSDGTTAGPVTIGPNASYLFDQGTETHPQKVFAGTLTSTQPVAVVIVQEGTIVKTVLATNGFSSDATQQDTTAFMPLVNTNNAGYVTGIQLQNAGSVSSDITLTYTPVPGYGTKCTETRTVAPGASGTFALYAFAGVANAGMTTTCTKQRFVGAAQVTGNTGGVKVVAVVNQTTSAQAEAYNSFAPAGATGRVVLPLIMDRNSGWYTGFTVANVGNNTVHVACTFTNTSYTVSGDLGPGGVLLDIQVNKIALKYVGSGDCRATVTSGSGSAQIVAVVNEIAPAPAGVTSYDGLLVYEGINQ